MVTSLITGGAGFIGSHLAEELVRLGRKAEIAIATAHNPIIDPSPSNIKAQAERLATIRFRGQLSLSDAERMVSKTAGPQNIIALMKDYRRLGISLVTLNISDTEEMKSFKDQVISKLRE